MHEDLLRGASAVVYLKDKARERRTRWFHNIVYSVFWFLAWSFAVSLIWFLG